ncbi:hypothetical protein [Arthrobacter oryzae]|uniref:hypothetical protein n=1 Tax=Arthrobacter oryzae TaxID=409290 RepID=UPI002781814D|nr:hypothetical protein [Arthrobacter oryzae]MDQ0078266.1 hypothetical protein [Arthrobacter oryzae]
MSTDEEDLLGFVPLRYTLPWPTNLVEFGDTDDDLPMIDRIGLTDFRHDEDAEGRTRLRLGVALLDELSLWIPGLKGFSVVFGAPKRDPQTGLAPPGARFTVAAAFGDPTSFSVEDVDVALRMQQDLLRPMKWDEDGGWMVRTDPSGAPLPFEIRLDGLGLAVDTTGAVELSFAGGAPGIEIDAFGIGDTGIVVEADQAVRLHVDDSAQPPPGRPQGWRGVHIPHAAVHLPHLDFPAVPSGLDFVDCTIGSGGFSGELDVTWDDGSARGSLLGVDIELLSAKVRFVQNTPVEFGIEARLTLPFFDQPVDVELALGLDGAFTIGLSAEGGLAEVELEDVLRLRLDGLKVGVEQGLATFSLSGAVTPLVEPVNWPTFTVKELSIDTAGHVKLAGGWLDLPDQVVLDFNGFALEVTRLGFGVTDDARHWVGFSGGLKLLEGMPAGASVDGLRISWDDAGDVGVSLDGVSVEFEVPDAVSFKGLVSYRDLPGGGQRFDGAIQLRLIALDLEVDAQLVIGRALDSASGDMYGFFAIYIGVELPVGIPLLSTGLGLYGMAGLFALNMEPNRRPEQNWYEDWYKKPTPGVADLAHKWDNKLGSLAFGAGVTLGTQSDNGYTFAGRILLVIAFPGPIILLEGKANLLKERAELGGPAEPTFRSLAVLDFRSGSLMFGLDAFYRTGDEGELIEIRGGVESFFDFHDGSAWYLNVGSDKPRDKRIRAGIFQIFQAEAWFMINAHRLYTGAWVGYTADEHFGPLALTFEAWIEGTALLSFKPPHFHGSLWLHGKLALTIFGFGFGLGLDARLDADVFEPLILRLELEITVDLPWPLPDFHKTFTKQWGPRPDPPPLSTPLTELSLAHPKVTTTWRLPRDGVALLRPDVDDGTGFLAPVGAVPPLDPAAAPPAGLPVVPLDVRPQLTFGRPVVDAAGLGVNAGAAGAEEGWEWIGDPVAGEGPVQIRTVLRSLELSRWRPATGGGGTWEAVARSPLDPARPALPTMYGAWAPVPALPAGDPAAVGNTKLLVWSRTPFDASRQTGQAWDEWFTAAFPFYPCPPPVPARRFCCDFRDLRVGDLVASPWHCPAHPEVTLSWPGGPREVVLLDRPVGGMTKALCGSGSYVDSQGTYPNPVTVTCSTPGVTTVTVQLPPDAVRPVRRCTDLTGLAPGVTANPLPRDGLGFEVPGAASITVVTRGGRVGLDCGRRLEVDLDGPAVEVELDVSAFGGAVTATGLDALGGGVAVDRTPPGVTAATLTLRGTGIIRVVVDAPSDEAALHQVCRTAPATTVTADGTKTATSVGADGLVRVTGSDLGSVVIGNPGDRVCVTSVCFTLPPDPAEVARREELVQHLVSELERWSETGAVLYPDTVYRLTVGTLLQARSDDPMAGYTSIAGGGYGLDRDQLEYGYFRTEGPPGLAAITGDDSGALGTLTPYVGQTMPPTVPDAGDRPALPRPVYRGYDVAIRFDVDYAELMYRLAGRDLGLYVFDSNNQPARDTGGRLLALTPEWTDARHDLTRSERQWSTLIEGSACVPALTRTFAPDRQLTVGSGTVLGADAVHEARLIPLLLHDDFRSGTGDWEVLDQGQAQGPSVWKAVRHPRLAGTSATVTGSAVRLDGAPDLTGVVPGLDVVVLAADTARPSGRWPVAAVDVAARTLTVDGVPAVTGTSGWQLPQLIGVAQTSGIRTTGDDPRDPVRPGTMLLRGAATWSDLRLAVTLRSAADGAIGVVVRVAGPSRYYRFSMDRAAGRRRLVRVLDGVHTVLAEDRWSYGLRNDYAITVEAVGDALRVHQDGVLVFDVRDAVLPTGRIGLYCRANPGALFSDVRVDDLSHDAPVVHRFSFTTSRFATFEHQVHSHPDEVWRSTATAAGAIAAAVPPASAPTEPEHRAYAALAQTVLGGAATAAVEAVEVTRIEPATGLAGWLIRSPEPVDWSRVSLALHATDDTAPAPDPPAALKLVGATFSTTSANGETVTVLSRAATDLDGHRIERRAIPGALAIREVEPLLRATAGDAAAGVVLTEDFGPNALDRYTIVDDENASLFPSAWAVADGHIVQTGQYFVASNNPDKPGTMAILNAPVLSAARIEAMLRSEDFDAIGLVFRYRDGQNFYRFSMALLDGYRRLTKKVGGITSVLWEDAERLPRRGHSYRVVLETFGEQLVGWLDGELLFAVRDGDLNAGRVGFYAWKNMGAHFEALQVTALSGDPVLWRPELGSLAGFSAVDAPGVVSGPSVWAAAAGVVTQSAAVRVEDETWADVTAPYAREVSAPPGGPVWLSADPPQAGGFTAHRRLGAGWVPAPGIGVAAIAATDRGLWALDATGQIWLWMPQIPGPLHWIGSAGTGTDIAAGGGALFLVSTVAVPGGGQVQIDRKSTGVWEPLDGQGAVTVAAGSDGVPWIVDDTNAVFRWDGAAWQPFPGSARAIAPDADSGRHWMIGTTAAPGGHALLRWDGRAWQPTGRGAVAIAAVTGGGVWTVDDVGAVVRFSGPSAARPGTHLRGGPADADDWEDVEVALRLGDLGTSDGGAVGLLFRYEDEANFYRLSLDRGAGRRLVRMQNGVATVLWRDAVRESPGQNHALTITAIGPQLRAVLDGEPLFTVSDASLARGRVALYCRDAAHARFTGLTVFDRTRRVGPWVIRDLAPGQSSDWRLARGVLTQEAPGSVDTAAISDERGWSDYRLTLQFGSDDPGVVGAVFRYRGDNDHYRFELDSVADRRRLVRRTAGNETVLWERPGGFAAGETYLLTVDAVGTRLRGWLGASPQFDLDHGDHRVGAVGHFARTTPSARFERIELTAPPRESLALLRDRFAAGNRAAFTDVDVPGTTTAVWRMDGADLVQSEASGTGLAVAGSSAWTDTVLTARLRPGPGGVAGLVVRYTDPSSHYRWRVDLGAGEHRLELVSGGVKTVLWRTPTTAAAWAAGRDLAIVATGSTLRGFVDDIPIFEVDDAALPAGRVALDAAGPARFSQVRVFDGSLAFDDWLVEPFEVPAGTDGDVVAGDQAWTDYRVSAHVRGSGTGVVGLLARYAGPQDHYRFSIDAPIGMVRLERLSGGAPVALWEGPRRMAPWDGVMVLECLGQHLSGYIDGERLFTVHDDALTAGQFGTHRAGDPDATFIRLRCGRPTWTTHYTFGPEPVPPGGSILLHSGNRAADPNTGPSDRYVARFDEVGTPTFPPDGVDLRLQTPDGSLGHGRRFRPPVAWRAVADTNLRTLRAPDGTGWFLGFTAGIAPVVGDHELVLTFRRDNHSVDPGAPVLRRAGDASDEVVTLLLPTRTVGDI